ncbi:MAG TPA: hypothetical protein VLU43_12680 [Anaeromyxobacteraceae bacterium]|nr:hypothetical protein [Anaeromyxobacteraceae bacterium]
MALRRDLIQRMVEQLAAALARVAALRRRGEAAAARTELDDAAARIAGVDPRMIAAVDSASVAGLVRDADRLAVLARLLLERASVEADAGDGAAGSAWRRRAVELGIEAAAGGAGLDPDLRAAIHGHPEAELAVRHREARSRLPRP